MDVYRRQLLAAADNSSATGNKHDNAYEAWTDCPAFPLKMTLSCQTETGSPISPGES